MLQQQISLNQDKDITIKLTEMANKLTTKTYQYETFTNDMLYMTELKELLKDAQAQQQQAIQQMQDQMTDQQKELLKDAQTQQKQILQQMQ